MTIGIRVALAALLVLACSRPATHAHTAMPAADGAAPAMNATSLQDLERLRTATAAYRDSRLHAPPASRPRHRNACQTQPSAAWATITSTVAWWTTSSSLKSRDSALCARHRWKGPADGGEALFHCHVDEERASHLSRTTSEQRTAQNLVPACLVWRNPVTFAGLYRSRMLIHEVFIYLHVRRGGAHRSYIKVFDEGNPRIELPMGASATPSFPIGPMVIMLADDFPERRVERGDR